MRDYELFDKCDRFEEQVKLLCDSLVKEDRGIVTANRLSDCSNGMTAYVRLAYMERSDEGFVVRMRVALEHAFECESYIRLLNLSKYLDIKSSATLLNGCTEIKQSILESIKFLTADSQETATF